MNQGAEPVISRHLRDVAVLLAEGKDNEEIADSLVISKHAAEKYVSELKRELGARNRVDLAFKCKELGSRLP